jgi:hypothetical protein
MFRALQRWRLRAAERRGAARRLAEVGRWDYAPFYRHSSLGKPRFGRFDTLFNPRRWLRRVMFVALLAGIVWIIWQSWRGLGVFDG